MTSRHVFTSSFLALLAGCAPMSPSYQNALTGPPKSIQPRDGYSLAFIEFGEQGSYQDTSQVAKAVELVRGTTKPLVITYVHGWHNNAVSNDVARFSRFLSEIAHTPLIQRQGFHVVGVYLGWRGEITHVPVLTELSFYSRKAAAERLASNFDCFDAISSVAEAARRYHRRDRQYTILLGHSFGGLVVERAVAHAIDAEMHGRSQQLNSLPADLTVVLNPASDSVLSRQIIAALYQEKTENARPIFVSITSSADKATSSIFPIGTSLAALTKSFNKVADPGAQGGQESERRFFTTTPGHNGALINHVATKLDSPFTPSPGLSAVEMNLSHPLGDDTVVLPKTGGGFELWQIRRSSPVDVPYWNVQVDGNIVKNHGDIWNPRAEALMAGIFSIANPHPQPQPHHRAAQLQQMMGAAPPPVVRHEANLQKPRDFLRAATKQPKTEPRPASSVSPQ